MGGRVGERAGVAYIHIGETLMPPDEEVDWHVPLAAIIDAIEAQPATGDRVRYAIRHGSMRVGAYAPQGRDTQSTHDQDELYIVAAGSGWFVKNGARRPVAVNDLLFVEAGADHRFEDFSDDFATWVIFWGPKGGEG